TVGPAIWRASWQAAALAILVVLLLRCFGERLAPRWRFLLWGVVLTRLLVVATPVSPWSVFNLARWYPEASARLIVHREADAMVTPVPHRPDGTAGPSETNVAAPPVADAEVEPALAPARAPAEAPSYAFGTTTEGTPPRPGLFDAVFLTRILSSVWLAG